MGTFAKWLRTTISHLDSCLISNTDYLTYISKVVYSHFTSFVSTTNLTYKVLVTNHEQQRCQGKRVLEREKKEGSATHRSG